MLFTLLKRSDVDYSKSVNYVMGFRMLGRKYVEIWCGPHRTLLALGEPLHTIARLEAAWKFSVWAAYMKFGTVNTALFFRKL